MKVTRPRRTSGRISFYQSVRIALGALRANLLRALLTTLGIIIGTGAVVAIIAVTEGNTASITSRLGALGPNVVVISPQSATGAGGVRAGAGTAQTLTLADATAMSTQVSHLNAISPIENAGNSTQIIFQNQNWNSRVQGVYPSYQQIGNWTLDEGQWFSQNAEDQQLPQVVIGATVAAELFTPLGIDPIGQTIRVGTASLTVVGVLHPKGASTFGANPDDILYIPLSTAQTQFVGASVTYVNTIEVQADTADDVNQVIADITTLLTQRHNGTQDFTVRNQNQITSTIQQTSQTLTILLVGIASISLVVGGIGIMNIMLVTVTERTREIGIRIAIGAREGDILTQFLLEAVVLTMAGGLVGIALGTGIGALLAHSFGWPFVIDGRSILLAFGVSALVGIVFGFYPAQRAARLDPITALRSE